MDKRIDIWNILHDAEITAISWQGGETLTICVSIEFLRRGLEPPGDDIVLNLSGVTHFEWHKCHFSVTPPTAEITIDTPEILGTKSKSMPVVIGTTLGTLTLEFQDIDFALGTGQEVELETIVKASEEYWSGIARKG